MKLHTFLTAATLTLAVATAYAVDGTFDRTLSTGSSPNVTAITGAGNIHLHPGTDNQVHIVAHLHSNSKGNDVNSRINQIASNPPIVQNGNDITIGEQHNPALYNDISIDYDITVPHASSLDAKSGSGDITIENAGSSLKASSGSGNLHALNIQATALFQTGSGDITINNLKGDLTARSGSGNIQVAGQPTSAWKFSTGSGNIHLVTGSAPFSLDASTGSGDISVAQPVSMQSSFNKHHLVGSVNGGGPTIHASSGSGDIQIK